MQQYQATSSNTSLNKDQEDAVRHLNGPCIVIAPPGSGKTTVLTRRIQYILEQTRISPERILVITFSRAAALEMQERFCRLMGDSYVPVTFGTFHAVFFQILRCECGYRGEDIMKNADKRRILREVLSEREDGESLFASFELLLEELAHVKAAEAYEPAAVSKDQFLEIYQSCERRRRQERKLDFDDMVLECGRLFSERPGILRAWQKRFSYLLIDEFQDISPQQYRIVKMLAMQHQNLFVVGDDDQAIYGFRGASPEIMLHMKDDYPKLREIYLTVNYRSQSRIVEQSVQFICHNQCRYPKQIRAVKGAGAPVERAGFLTRQEQFEEIRRILLRQKEASVAILLRTNSQAILLAQYLEQNQIAFQLKERIQNPYTGVCGRDILAYLELASGNRSRELFFRIMNKPLRYLSRRACSENTVSFSQLRACYRERPYMYGILKKLQTDLEHIRRLPPYAAVMYIRKEVGYERYLREQNADNAAFLQGKLEELQLLQESAGYAESYGEWREQILHFEEKNEGNRNQKKAAASQGVVVATMHSVKGLEYETVIIPDCNEGILPHQKAFRPEEIEEERRLFYVAMTRAKKELYLFYLSPKGDERKQPSRFLSELDP